MLSKYLPRYVGCAGLAELGLCCPPLLFSAAAPVSAERALLLPLIQLQVSKVSRYGKQVPASKHRQASKQAPVINLLLQDNAPNKFDKRIERHKELQQRQR